MPYTDDRLEDLSHDHHDISSAGRELSRLIGLGHVDAAQARFASFALAFLEHMRAEEEGVYAELEGQEEFAGSIRRLRAEHERLREVIATAQRTSDDDSWAELVGGLLAAFALHEVEEEEDLFRAAETALPFPVSHG